MVVELVVAAQFALAAYRWGRSRPPPYGWPFIALLLDGDWSAPWPGVPRLSSAPSTPYS
jgi:hypothetical protein